MNTFLLYFAGIVGICVVFYIALMFFRGSDDEPTIDDYDWEDYTETTTTDYDEP